MSEAPERIWTCSHLGEYGRYYPEAVEAEGEHGGVAVEYIRADHVDAREAQASAEGFDRGVKEAQPIVESLRAELHSLYDAIGFDPLDLENGHDNARAAIDALLKAEREKALREAAEKVADLYGEYSEGVPYCDRDEAVAVIEALISEDKTDGVERKRK